MSISYQQATGPQSIDSSCWRIDPARSSVEFHVKTFWGLVTVKGRFERYQGTLDLRRIPAIELTIDATSLNTNNKLRDKHLRAADFFDVGNHPQVTFVSETVTLEGERLKVRGMLRAAGRGMRIDVDASLRQVGDELELVARTQANHHEVGMTHSTLGMIRTPSDLIVRGSLFRDDAS